MTDVHQFVVRFILILNLLVFLFYFNFIFICAYGEIYLGVS